MRACATTLERRASEIVLPVCLSATTANSGCPASTGAPKGVGEQRGATPVTIVWMAASALPYDEW